MTDLPPHLRAMRDQVDAAAAEMADEAVDMARDRPPDELLRAVLRTFVQDVLSDEALEVTMNALALYVHAHPDDARLGIWDAHVAIMEEIEETQ